MNPKPVVVYGAAGYTGRLVCEYLRELNVPFTAAGFDKGELQAVLSRIPGLESVQYDVIEAAIQADRLREVFAGAQVVINTVGPFTKYGPELVQASLGAGCHYIDPSGEQSWLLHAQSQFGAQFAAQGLLLAPGVAHMYTTGEIAANLCLETPGLDTLDILVLWKGFPSAASARTIFTNLKKDWFYLEQNEYKKGEPLTTFEVAVPGQHEITLALPWGGTSHPVWFKNDPRVANVKVAGGMFNRNVMERTLEAVRSLEQRLEHLTSDQQTAELERLAGSVQPSTPPRENPRINVTLDSVHASGLTGRAHCVIHGNCNYKQTALLQAYAAYSLLQQAPRRIGFASACQAFGYRELLGTLKGFGLVLDPILTVNGRPV